MTKNASEEGLSGRRYFDEEAYTPEMRDRNYRIAGVALRDYSKKEWEALPEHLRRSADATGWYLKKPKEVTEPLVVEERSTQHLTKGMVKEEASG